MKSIDNISSILRVALYVTINYEKLRIYHICRFNQLQVKNSQKTKLTLYRAEQADAYCVGRPAVVASVL